MDDLPPRRASRPQLTLVQDTQKPRDPVDVHVGGRIMAFRRARGLSQTELARRLAVSFQQIQKYETGANRISASRLWAAGQAMDVPIDDFFVGLETGNGPHERVAGLLEREATRLNPTQQKSLVAFLRSVRGQP